MRSIFVLLILVMIGLNGKGQSVTALPDSVLSQCCLEVTLLNGNVTTVDWVFIQYITRDGTGTKLFVEYAPNFGGIQWETQIRIQDNFDDVLARSKFIILPFTVGTTDYGIHRNWIANLEENTTTGGTWIYGRFGTPTKRKFSAVEDYETLKNLLLACRPRAIVVAENGLYAEGDTVRMGGFLIENTTITTEGYNWMMKDTSSTAEFGIDYITAGSGDTTVYWARRSGSVRQMMQMGRRYWYNTMKDTIGGLEAALYSTWNNGDPYFEYQTFNPVSPLNPSVLFRVKAESSVLLVDNPTTNPYYTPGLVVTSNSAQIGVNESGSGDPGNGVLMGAFGDGTSNEYLFMVTKGVDNNTATNGQFLQLVDDTNGKVEFATIDLSGYLSISDTAAMLDPYIQGAGTITRIPIFTGARVIGNSPIAYNSTTKRTTWDSPGILELPMGTDAQRPTATTSDFWYNTTGNGIEWYNGTRWAKGLESTFNRGTSTRVPFFDANGQLTESANLTYTGTRFQTGGSIRIGFNNATNDTASIEKVIDANSKIVRFNNPGSSGGYSGGYIFRGGQNGALATVNTFRIYTNSTTVPGSVYIGNVTESGANTGNSTTNLGILNKITSTNLYDTGVNLNPGGTSPNNFSAYSLTNGKHFGLFIGGQGGTNQLQSMSDVGYGVYAGFQYQPLTNGYGSSWVFVAKNDASTPTEILRLQGKDGNVCLGCTNAQYQLYTTNTGAYGFPRGTVAQRPTIVTSTTPLRYNTDSTALEYGESVGTWRQIATRAYARSLVAGLSTGTVTSVGLSLPSIFSVSGSPVTTSGTLSASFTGGNTRQVLRGDGVWANTLDSFRINQSLASVERFEVNGNIVLNRGSGSNKLILTRNWTQEISAGGSNGNMNFANGSGQGFQNYFLLGTVAGIDTMVTMHYDGLGVAVGKSNKIQARLHVKGKGSTTGKTMLLEDSGGADILTITDNKTIQAHGYGTGTKEAADLSKTQSNYIAGFATDGTVLDLPISSLRNGIYTGGDTLASLATYAEMRQGDDGQYFTLGDVRDGGSFEGNADEFGLLVKKSVLTFRKGFSGFVVSLDQSEMSASTDGVDESIVRLTPDSIRMEVDSGNINLVVSEGYEVNVRGKLNANRESYHRVTSTTSPDTLSSVYSDNIIDQGSTQASFTLAMPSNPQDGQVCTITYVNAITTLTIDGNGETIVGSAVTTGVPGSQRKFKYCGTCTTPAWIKIY